MYLLRPFPWRIIVPGLRVIHPGLHPIDTEKVIESQTVLHPTLLCKMNCNPVTASKSRGEGSSEDAK